MPRDFTDLSRRALLRSAVTVGAAWAGVQLTGCSDDTTIPADSSAAAGRSRPAPTTANGSTAANASSSSPAGSPILLVLLACR
jgi:hypothetical protein